MTVDDVDVSVATIEQPRLGGPEHWLHLTREITRGIMAVLLFLLLSFEVGVQFSQLHSISKSNLNKEDQQASAKIVMDLLNVVIPPTVALFGAATGFYYGARSARGDG